MLNEVIPHVVARWLAHLGLLCKLVQRCGKLINVKDYSNRTLLNLLEAKVH